MAIFETDFDLLEEYLDGALDTSAVAKLQGRLAIDQDLSAALKLARSQRTVRSAALKSMEPDELTAERLVWRVRGAMHDQRQPVRVWSQWRIASIGSSVAACLVLGFFAGRIGRGGAVSPETTPRIAANNPQNSGFVAMKQNDPSPAQSQFVAVGHTPQFSVPITNEYGQVVAWQNFDNSEQAKNFTEELHHAHSETAPAAGSGAIRTVDHEEQVPF